MPRKTPGKMRLFLIKDVEGEANTIIDSTQEGEISDVSAKAMVTRAGPGQYVVITGRVRKATLETHTVTSFTLT